MSHEDISVQLLEKDGKIRPVLLQVALEPPWSITLVDQPYAAIHVVGDDLFDALIRLRQQLNLVGSKLLCRGAAKDVYPSRMGRQMGGGRRAYKLTLGHQAHFSDLVDIFEYTDAAQISDVDEQKTFYEQWLESLRN